MAGGTAFDRFFPAMVYAQLVNREEARDWLGEATVGVKLSQTRNAELSRLCDEADALSPAVLEASATPCENCIRDQA
jgi:hypothetical protein